ncbi:DNA polymerase III PolC-type [Candidatus Hepatincola sp. Pdp]
MSRKILLDVETTGLNANGSDKIVEIACIELLDDNFGKEFHFYLNPEREIPFEATKVHGITNEKVQDCPVFEHIVEDLLTFIGDSPIIAHNAEFDRGFVNAELMRCGKELFPKERYIDTLVLARKKFPDQKNTLDHLCNRFNIDLKARAEYHGALIDTMLLGKVYLRLVSKEHLFDEDQHLVNSSINGSANYVVTYDASYFTLRKYTLSESEKQRHWQFLVENISNHLWTTKL